MNNWYIVTIDYDYGWEKIRILLKSDTELLKVLLIKKEKYIIEKIDTIEPCRDYNEFLEVVENYTNKPDDLELGNISI